MGKVLCGLFSLAFVALAAQAYAGEPADEILGQWYTEGNESVVEIYQSGDCYYGKIVWLKDPKKADGTDKVDSNNPDVSKKNRKVAGMDILTGFTYDGKGKWTSGKIYDPNNGKTYSCNGKLQKDKLSIRGFVGVSALGRTTIWKRVEQKPAATEELTSSQ